MPLLDTVTDISSLIDERNRELWEQILKEYTVSIEYSPNQEHHLYTKGQDAIIYIPRSQLCIDSFAHELLHIYIRLKQVFIGAGIKLSMQSSAALSPIWNTNLCYHVDNCLDHLKMFPIYINLGFKKEKFLFDYSCPKYTDEQINEIKGCYKILGKILPTAAEHFIARFFAMKSDPNDSFNYSYYLAELQRTDEELYQILIDFLNAWTAYDIEINDPIVSSYHVVSYKFQNDLEAWAEGHEFFGI